MEQTILLQIMIISFILLTLMFDSGVIMKGEIRCQSLMGVKGLNPEQPYSIFSLEFSTAYNNSKLRNNTTFYFTFVLHTRRHRI